jgi:hypothetical protein
MLRALRTHPRDRLTLAFVAWNRPMACGIVLSDEADSSFVTPSERIEDGAALDDHVNAVVKLSTPTTTAISQPAVITRAPVRPQAMRSVYASCGGAGCARLTVAAIDRSASKARAKRAVEAGRRRPRRRP